MNTSLALEVLIPKINQVYQETIEDRYLPELENYL
jgi:hypothetical protein